MILVSFWKCLIALYGTILKQEKNPHEVLMAIATTKVWFCFGFFSFLILQAHGAWRVNLLLGVSTLCDIIKAEILGRKRVGFQFLKTNSK